jgi:hypothetical protein
MNTYTPTSADVGKMITCRVTASNSGGSTPATSAGVGPVTQPATVRATINRAIPAAVNMAGFATSAGDRIVIVFRAQGTVGGIGDGASAWTLVGNVTLPGGGVMQAYVRDTLATGASVGTITFGAAIEGVCKILFLQGTTTASTNSIQTANFSSTGTSSTPTAPTVTATAARMLLSLYGTRGDPGTITLPTGQTAAGTTITSTQSSVFYALAVGVEQVASGATGTRAATASNSVQWAGGSILVT